MKTITLRDITIGTGRPKICVSISGKNRAEILDQARRLLLLPIDLIEWRADWYDEAMKIECVLETAAQLREILIEKPLLFTFRTAPEGGERSVSPDQYKSLNYAVSDSGLFDLLDIEVFCGDDIVAEMIKRAHKNGIYIIASNHDFRQTPDKAELIRRLCKMQKMDADITKIAVMPRSREDVLTLLAASVEMRELYADRPFISMSMGAYGMVSRLIGEFTGSAVTFGMAGTASAPGQLEAEALSQVLDIIHRNIQ